MLPTEKHEDICLRCACTCCIINTEHMSKHIRADQGMHCTLSQHHSARLYMTVPTSRARARARTCCTAW